MWVDTSETELPFGEPADEIRVNLAAAVFVSEEKGILYAWFTGPPSRPGESARWLRFRIRGPKYESPI